MAEDLIHIPLADINADQEFNCRTRVVQLEVVELAKSIRQLGLMSPVVVRKQGDGRYQLIAGYRRFTSYKMLCDEDPIKFGTIPAVVKVCTDLEAFRMNLVENVQRTNLNIKEEAHACERLLDNGMTPDEVAKELGKSRGWLQTRQQMIDLPEDIQNEIVAYNFTQSQIRELWQAKNDEARYEMVKKVKGAKDRGEKVTVIEKRERPLDKKLTPKKGEIFEKMEEISENYGRYNIVTRALAWAAGEVTDRVINTEILNDALNARNLKVLLETINNPSSTLEQIREAAKSVRSLA